MENIIIYNVTTVYMTDKDHFNVSNDSFYSFEDAKKFMKNKTRRLADVDERYPQKVESVDIFEGAGINQIRFINGNLIRLTLTLSFTTR